MIFEKGFKFIDLFAGIGGFHCAMKKFACEKKIKTKCVFASEINEYAKKIYSEYFKMGVYGDITKAEKTDISEYYDVVCGGFPCQTFSKAGMQQGFGDPRGTLFREITRLIEFEDITKQPKIVILENVRNLITHDKGITWNTIKAELQRIHYNVIETPLIVGPKDFGIPQLRERAVILAVRNDIYNGKININIERKGNNTTSIFSIINRNLSNEEMEKYRISEKEEMILDAWNAFIKGINAKRIGYPIWSDEFGKDYDITELPKWKQGFINKNRELYRQNKKFIDKWMMEYNVKTFTPTNRKFEWQVDDKIHDVYEGIIQFRPSGIRVKQATESPTLVAMVHVPIIGKLKRYLTPLETARLQSFPSNYPFINENDFNAYKQLGNAVNVDVIYNVFKMFIDFIDEKTSVNRGEKYE